MVTVPMEWEKEGSFHCYRGALPGCCSCHGLSKTLDVLDNSV